MSPDPDRTGESRKIFARNLTARADAIVRGNPANSRPDSGVDNCYPGLEFDQRNLEQAFFPGLTFEFHRPDGAIVIAVDETKLPGLLSDADSPASRPLFLWFLYGRTMPEKEEPTLFSFRGHSGSEVWRRVRDLLPGRMAILVGPSPGVALSFKAQDAYAALKTAWKDGKPIVRRAGEATPARLVGRRAGPWRVSGLDLHVSMMNIAGKYNQRDAVKITFSGDDPLDEQSVIRAVRDGHSGLKAETVPGTGLLILTSETRGSGSRLCVSGPAAHALGLETSEVAGRESSGAILYAVLVGERARYLDCEGVIDVNAYPPGELTKTMCAPWMYDFRDCYCFYWASSKPDVVDVADATTAGENRPPRFLNFMRRDPTDPTPDTGIWDERRDRELTYADLVEDRGWERRLRVVLGDQEVPDPTPAPPPESPDASS